MSLVMRAPDALGASAAAENARPATSGHRAVILPTLRAPFQSPCRVPLALVSELA